MDKDNPSADKIDTRTYVDVDGNLIAEHWQDIEPALDFNKATQNTTDGFSPDREMKAIYEVPLIVLEKMRERGINWMNPHHHKEVMKELAKFGNAFRCSYDNPNPHILVKGDR